MALKLPEILVPLSLNQYYELGAVPLFFFALVLATALAYGSTAQTVVHPARLIARGDERYFVFDALDQATCTPKEILR